MNNTGKNLLLWGSYHRLTILEYLVIHLHIDSLITLRMLHGTSTTKTHVLVPRITPHHTPPLPIAEGSLNITAVIRIKPMTVDFLLMDMIIGLLRAVAAVSTIANGRQAQRIATSTSNIHSRLLHRRAGDCRRALIKATINIVSRAKSYRKVKGRRRTQRTVIEICHRQRVTRSHLGPQGEALGSVLPLKPRLRLHQLPSPSLISPKGCNPGKCRLVHLNPHGIGCPADRLHRLRDSSQNTSNAVIEIGIGTEVVNVKGVENVTGAAIGAARGAEAGIEAETPGTSGRRVAASESPGAGVIEGEIVDLRVVVKDEEVIGGQISDQRGLGSVLWSRRTCRQNKGSQPQGHTRGNRRPCLGPSHVLHFQQSLLNLTPSTIGSQGMSLLLARGRMAKSSRRFTSTRRGRWH